MSGRMRNGPNTFIALLAASFEAHHSNRAEVLPVFFEDLGHTLSGVLQPISLAHL